MDLQLCYHTFDVITYAFILLGARFIVNKELKPFKKYGSVLDFYA